MAGTLPAAAEWAEIIQICSDCGAYLFSDEMYRGMETDPACRLTPACDLYEGAVSLSGLSKVGNRNLRPFVCLGSSYVGGPRTWENMQLHVSHLGVSWSLCLLADRMFSFLV
jgi:hypothetical protein